MGLRPGQCYNTKKDRAYTRTAVKVHKRNYIGATPGLKTRQFNMGNPLKKYDRLISLHVKEHAQVRDNAIESTRIAINRALVKELGKDGFFMRIHVYPFHILRENKMATGAGADRVSQGMGNCPFGKPIGRAVRVRPNQRLFSVLATEEEIEIVKKALMKAKPRITCGISIQVSEDIKAIGTLPRKIKRIVEEKKEEKEGEEAEEGEEKEEGKGKEKKEDGKKEETKEVADKKDGKTEKKEGKK